MSESNEQQVAMQLILAAGDAKKFAFEGIQAAKNGEFDSADSKFTAATKRLSEGHQVQTAYLSQHSGQETSPSLLMVHAQDHLSMAMTTIDLGQEIVSVYKQLNQK